MNPASPYTREDLEIIDRNIRYYETVQDPAYLSKRLAEIDLQITGLRAEQDKLRTVAQTASFVLPMLHQKRRMVAELVKETERSQRLARAERKTHVWNRDHDRRGSTKRPPKPLFPPEIVEALKAQGIDLISVLKSVGINM